MARDPRFAGDAPENPAPPPPNWQAEMAALREQVEALKAARTTHSAANDAIVARHAEEILQRSKSTQEQAYMRAECEKTAQQRTQEAADRLYSGPVRYRVSVPGDKTHTHPVEIPAHSAEEAQSRYDRLCGVLFTEHPHIVEAAL